MITYDSVRSIRDKCNYIKKVGLGGIMFWELSGDIPGGSNGSLVDAAFLELFGHN